MEAVLDNYDTSQKLYLIHLKWKLEISELKQSLESMS